MALRRSLVLCCCLLLAACGTAPYEPGDTPHLLVTFPETEFEARQIPVGAVRAYSAGEWAVSARVLRHIESLGKRYGLRRVDVWPIRSLGVQCAVYAVAADRDIEQLLKAIAAEPGVDGAQRLHAFDGLETPIPPLAGPRIETVPAELQWGEHASRMAALHRLSRGSRARVGIVDTLVDEHHPDLRPQVRRQHDFARTGIASRAHGTAVAGVIAARGERTDGLVGIAPEAHLHVYGACRGSATGGARCDSFGLAKALEQAHEDSIGVLNMSLTGPHDALLARMLGVLLDSGVVVIAAASPELSSGGFPASLPGVVAIGGATAQADAGSGVMTTGHDSCLNWIVDPEKLSTRAGGGYQFFYGSSMSAAGLSGLAALLRAHGGAEDTASMLRGLLGGEHGGTRAAQPAFVDAVRDALSCNVRAAALTAFGPSLRRAENGQ